MYVFYFRQFVSKTTVKEIVLKMLLSWLEQKFLPYSTAAASPAQNKQVTASNKSIYLKSRFFNVAFSYVASFENSSDILTNIVDLNTIMHF